MLIGDDRLFTDHTGTCLATSPETVCPRCGRAMVMSKDGMIKVVASFACGCARIDLNFMDMSHGQATIWYVEIALYAIWGERGAAVAPVLLAPEVEEINRWRHSPCG